MRTDPWKKQFHILVSANAFCIQKSLNKTETAVGAESRPQQLNSSLLLYQLLAYQCQRAPFAMPGMAAVSLFVFLGTVLIIAPLRLCFTSQPCCLSGLIFILYKCSHYKDLTWGEYKWEDECTLRTCLYRNCIDQRSGRVKHMPALMRSCLQRPNSFLSHRSGVTPRLWKQVNLTVLLNWNRRCKLFPVIIIDHCCMAPRSSLQANAVFANRRQHALSLYETLWKNWKSKRCSCVKLLGEPCWEQLSQG